MMAGSCSYPHPVLGNLDDVDGRMDVEIEVSIGATVHVSGKFDLHNEDVVELVRRGNAARMVRCTCRRTFLRTSHVLTDDTFEFHLDKKDVFGEIRLEPFVVANDRIAGYAPSTMNAEYGAASFDIAAGQVLAVGNLHRFDADADYDPLRNMVASLVRIDKGNPEGKPYDVDYEADRILIRISDDAWRSYQGVKSRVPKTIILGLVVPVLAEAVKMMGSEQAMDLADFLWYQRLSKILERRGTTLPSAEPLATAQELVGNPLEKAMKDLDTKLHGDDE